MSGTLALAGLLSIAACSAIPNAVVAVPKSPEKPVYQVDRLEQVQGGELRWAFVNDQARGTEIQFRFATTSPLEADFTMVCVTVERRLSGAPRRRPNQSGGEVGACRRGRHATGAGSGERSALHASRGQHGRPIGVCRRPHGPKQRRAGFLSLSIYQDGVLKQDPVIVIRTS